MLVRLLGGRGSCQARLDRALGLSSASPRSPSRNSNPLPSVSLWDGRGKWIPLPWRSHPCEEAKMVGCARLPPPSHRPCTFDPFAWRTPHCPSFDFGMADRHSRWPSPPPGGIPISHVEEVFYRF